MTDLKFYNALVYDYGNFFQIAQRLGKEDGFAYVYYWAPYVHNGFPDHRPIDIGRNVPDVTRIKEWAEIIEEADLVYFPDCHEGELQLFFQKVLNKKVFGSRCASDLEHDRAATKLLMKQLGLPVNEYHVATGMDELEQLLKEHEDVYVKSSLRGDSETWKSKNYTLSKGELQKMRSHFGAYQNKETFIVEKPVDSIAEVGIDTFCVDGMYPEFCLTGIELKDTGYLGKITHYMDLPMQLRRVTDAFSPIFRDYGYRGWHSNEVIISGDAEGSVKGYLIDLTQRNASPPTDLALEMIEDYPNVVWDVANGVLPTVKSNYQYGVQLVMKSEQARTDPSPLIVPSELQRFVKVKNLTIDDDGTWYYTPMGIEMTEIGSVIGMGNSIEEAVAMASMVADSIKGFDIKINTDCIDDARRQIDRLDVNGIKYLQ